MIALNLQTARGMWGFDARYPTYDI